MIITSIADLERHVSSLSLREGSDVWWICPVCGQENYGLRYSGTTLCPGCQRYAHPRADDAAPPCGTQIAELRGRLDAVEIEIEKIQGRLADLETEKKELESSLSFLSVIHC